MHGRPTAFEGGARPAASPRWLGTWAVAFLLLFGLAASWSIATPMFGSVDEPAQMTRATAVAHGQIFGRKTSPAAISVKIPAGIAREIREGPGCFAFKPYQPAGCAPKLSNGKAHGTTSISTYVGHYPPLYYAISGLPTLFTDRPVVLYLMRVVSAALSAAFLAAAFCAALRSRRYLLAPAGVALALTPMALFMAGVVNPNGLEISTAICVWTTALALAGDPDLRSSRFLIGWLAVSAGVLVQTRGLSPVFAAAAAGGTLLLFGWRAWVPVLRKRAARVGTGFVVVCSAFALVWFVVVNPTRITPAVAGPVHKHGVSLLSTSYHHYVWMIPQMVGFFGWLDTPSPQVSYDIWYAVLVLFGLLAVARRWWRGIAVVATLVAVNVIVPVLLTAREAHKYGLVGQGRDWLPLAVSLPLVGAFVARRLLPSAGDPGASRSRFAVRPEARYYVAAVVVAMATLALGAAEMGGFLNALHRYRNGLGNPVHLFGSAGWTPPFSPVLIVVVAAALELAWCAWAGGFTARSLVREGQARARAHLEVSGLQAAG